MITGAGQADCALLVINSVKGEFETGFDFGGQTREHSLLVKSLGVGQLVVAVNKMDMSGWSKQRFDEIVKKLGSFLIKQVGFKENDIIFVPCSGLSGENLSNKSTNEKLTSWYNDSFKYSEESAVVVGGLTLLDCINRLKPCERPIDKPLRFCISDVFKGLQANATSLAGKMESGTVKCGDSVCIAPSNQRGVVKSIAQTDEQTLSYCFAGDSVILNVAGVDINNISVGNFVCDCINPLIPVTDRIKAKIIIFNLEIPLTKGFPVN
jgi:elongation factor 1 alpha-like protein